jgi:hypothetical protein
MNWLSNLLVVAVLQSLGPITNPAPGQFRYDLVTTSVERGPGTVLKIRISDPATGLPLPDVDISDAFVDRSPQGQSNAKLPAFVLGSQEYGVYAFRAALPVDGLWALNFTGRRAGQVFNATITVQVGAGR